MPYDSSSKTSVVIFPEVLCIRSFSWQVSHDKSTMDRSALLLKGERDEMDKPRHIYRIRKTDYTAKLPPIKQRTKRAFSIFC